MNLHCASASWIRPAIWRIAALSGCIIFIYVNLDHKSLTITLFTTMNDIKRTPKTPSRREGLNSRLDPGVQVVNFDSTQRAAYTYMGRASKRVVKSGTRGFWSLEFWPKISLLRYWGEIEEFSCEKTKARCWGKMGVVLGEKIYWTPTPYESWNDKHWKSEI